MYPDYLRKPVTSFPAGQRGFLMPVAMFIIVAMGLFALALWRTTAQSGVSAVQELITLQAFYAAESGAQEGMGRLFYPNASSRAIVDSQCADINPTNRSYNGTPGLNNCSAVISCSLVDDPIAGFSFYTITSEAECGTGNIRSVRTLRVSAFMRQE